MPVPKVVTARRIESAVVEELLGRSCYVRFHGFVGWGGGTCSVSLSKAVGHWLKDWPDAPADL